MLNTGLTFVTFRNLIASDVTMFFNKPPMVVYFFVIILLFYRAE